MWNEMVCVAEDKLLACHDGLEGHLPPGAPCSTKEDACLTVFRLRSTEGAVVNSLGWNEAELQVVGSRQRSRPR